MIKPKYCSIHDQAISQEYMGEVCETDRALSEILNCTQNKTCLHGQTNSQWFYFSVLLISWVSPKYLSMKKNVTHNRQWIATLLKLLSLFVPFIFYSSFNKIILQFYCEQSVKESLVVSCVFALPMLHFLRGESKPFEDVNCDKPVDVRNWKWWGLDDLPYRKIRGNVTKRFVSLYLCNSLVCYTKWKIHFFIFRKNLIFLFFMRGILL